KDSRGARSRNSRSAEGRSWPPQAYRIRCPAKGRETGSRFRSLRSGPPPGPPQSCRLPHGGEAGWARSERPSWLLGDHDRVEAEPAGEEAPAVQEVELDGRPREKDEMADAVGRGHPQPGPAGQGAGPRQHHQVVHRLSGFLIPAPPQAEVRAVEAGRAQVVRSGQEQAPARLQNPGELVEGPRGGGDV